MRILLLVWLLLAGPTAYGCLWDSDTLAEQADGAEDLVWVITGRFPRNPPLYYEMRLKRVSEELKGDPSLLEAYDDAGVSCDRLGRGDEAIQWMEKKRAELERREKQGEDVREHRYRYLANLGTFYAHRWVRTGADRARMEDNGAGTGSDQRGD